MILAAIVLFLAIDHMYLEMFTFAQTTTLNAVGLFLILTGIIAYFYLWQTKEEKKHVGKDY